MILADTTISDVTAIISAVGTALVLIVGAVAAGAAKILAGQKAANKERDANQLTNDKTLKEIHVQTNSNLSKIQASLDTAMEKIAGLERRLGEREGTITDQKVELAKMHTPVAAASPEPVPVVVVPDKPVPVTISEQSKEKAGTDSR